MHLITPKAVALYANTNPSNKSWCLVFTRRTSSLILLRPHSITAQALCKTVSSQPFPLKTQHNLLYTEARHNYPTATSQAKKWQFQKGFFKYKQALMYCSPGKNSTNHHPWDTCLCLASSWASTLSQVLVRMTLTLTTTLSPCWICLEHCVLGLKHTSETVICSNFLKMVCKPLIVYDQIRFLCKDVPGADLHLLHTEYLTCSLNHHHLKWKWKTERNKNWKEIIIYFTYIPFYVYNIACNITFNI